MDDGTDEKDLKQNQKDIKFEILLAEYEFARENRIQGDATAWEVTAIIWGGQTLLLGFVLEAISQPPAKLLIVGAGILGILMSRFNHVIMRTRTEVCREMNKVCMEIEDRVPMLVKTQNRLDNKYPSGIQSRWFKILNWAFVPLWVLVIIQAGYLYVLHVVKCAVQ